MTTSSKLADILNKVEGVDTNKTLNTSTTINRKRGKKISPEKFLEELRNSGYVANRISRAHLKKFCKDLGVQEQYWILKDPTRRITASMFNLDTDKLPIIHYNSMGNVQSQPFEVPNFDVLLNDSDS